MSHIECKGSSKTTIQSDNKNYSIQFWLLELHVFISLSFSLALELSVTIFSFYQLMVLIFYCVSFMQIGIS